VFWGQAGQKLPDHVVLRVGLAKSAAECKKPMATFHAMTASSDGSRVRGLSHRSDPLAPDEAMLFGFDKPQRVAFWMKDTHIPLEIAFFDDKGRLTQVEEMPVEKDPSNPTGNYNSSSEALLALETAPGKLKRFKPKSTVLCVDAVPTQ
jgi:uncharacterized membrane protein (UPF0127 family)